MSNVELSIQLQTDSIAAVKSAMAGAIVDRPDNTFWWLTDYSHDIIYQNRITGTELVALDLKINNADISTVFSGWFGMQNSYFASDHPIPNVTTLKQAIETYYRWRVADYFNQVMQGASSSSVIPQYVFPNPDYVLGTYTAGGITTGTFAPGSGVIDFTKVGPGILALKPVADMNGDLTFTITAVYQDNSTVPIIVTVDGASEVGTWTLVGESAVSSVVQGTGVVTLDAASTLFKPGLWVLLREDMTGTTDHYWKTEIAEVKLVTDSTHFTLGQPRLAGVTTPVVAGLRNSFSASAVVYPLFINATAADNSNTAGTAADAVAIGFDPDRPQGFLDLTGISFPQ